MGFFSCEVTSERVNQNIVSQVCDIPGNRLRANTLTPQERDRFDRRASQIAALPLFVEDSSGLSISAARATARRWKSQYHIGALLVDYLQLMHGDGGERGNREQEVASVARGLKEIAKELRIAVIALAQINRGVEQRTDKRPGMADLRESGEIEAAADYVLLLYREGYYKRDRTDLQNVAEVIVGKNRGGPTPIVTVNWTPEYARFDG